MADPGCGFPGSDPVPPSRRRPSCVEAETSSPNPPARFSSLLMLCLLRGVGFDSEPHTRGTPSSRPSAVASLCRKSGGAGFRQTRPDFSAGSFWASFRPSSKNFGGVEARASFLLLKADDSGRFDSHETCRIHTVCMRPTLNLRRRSKATSRHEMDDRRTMNQIKGRRKHDSRGHSTKQPAVGFAPGWPNPFQNDEPQRPERIGGFLTWPATAPKQASGQE